MLIKSDERYTGTKTVGEEYFDLLACYKYLEDETGRQVSGDMPSGYRLFDINAIRKHGSISDLPTVLASCLAYIQRNVLDYRG